MENDEFRNLIGIAGWSQAETARQLGMTSGAVNQIVKGSVKPSPVTMRLLRILVTPSDTGTQQGQTDWRSRALAAESALEQIQSICATATKGRASAISKSKTIPPITLQGEAPKINSDSDRKLAGQAIQLLGKAAGQISGSPGKTASRTTKTKSSHDNLTEG